MFTDDDDDDDDDDDGDDDDDDDDDSDNDDNDDLFVLGLHQFVPFPYVNQSPECLPLGPEWSDGSLGLRQETAVLCLPGQC